MSINSRRIEKRLHFVPSAEHRTNETERALAQWTYQSINTCILSLARSPGKRRFPFCLVSLGQPKCIPGQAQIPFLPSVAEQAGITDHGIAVLFHFPIHILSKLGVEGPPDLLVEILSPATAKYDRISKKQLYARYGVRWFWIVDPDVKR